ncbi:MAG TPA: DegT/DnrJ/EryC1/StrS family aminotransferase [Candidatus Binataceae bacterium]
MSIKFLDLAALDREIAGPVAREFDAINATTSYVGGPAVAAFQREFARYLGVAHVVGVGSGTDALRLALMALGIGPGDGVITVPMTFIATAAAIAQCGAMPEFVDVDPATCNLGPESLRRYLEAGRFRSPNGPRAVVPVDLYGLPCASGQIAEVARQHKLLVVEDACQAHGAELQTARGWVKAGTLADAACFSFYPGKNLGAWGDAGALATNHERVAAIAARLGDHGRTSHYGHDAYGYNSRLDTLQAAVLRAKLDHLDAWNRRRREIAARYRELLSTTGVRIPEERAGFRSCYHLFTIQSTRREAIRAALTNAGIGNGIHYPLPLHLQPACAALGYRPGDFPVSERIAETTLSLPMHPHLTDAEIETVAAVVRGAL